MRKWRHRENQDDGEGGKRGNEAVEAKEMLDDKREDNESGLSNISLTMTYSHMGKPHTTIGAKSFHF